jgi:hypothetical protein
MLLDAPSLVEEDNKRVDRGQSYEEWHPFIGGPVEFVKHAADGESPFSLSLSTMA